MSSHVGTVIVGGFSSEKEAIAEKHGGQLVSSTMDPNFPFEQGKPWCMPILSYPLSLSFYACKYIMHLGIGI
jgi:hypothetical protein